MRHGPRLGAEIGAVAGTVFPVAGNLVGALVGALVGGPLGFGMGLVGGAINRRWGWALGGALPGLVLLGILAASDSNSQDLGIESFWILLCVGVVPPVGGAWAGWRLGDALERSSDLHFASFRSAAELGIEPASLYLRLGLLSVFLLTLAEPVLWIARPAWRYWFGQ
jgi:hypothetical protein